MNRTCKRCGRVAFAVSRTYAEESVIKFNEYYNSLSIQQQQDLYGGKKASIFAYERCMVCGACYHQFRKSKKKDCPMGCTLNPIIWDRLK